MKSVKMGMFGEGGDLLVNGGEKLAKSSSSGLGCLGGRGGLLIESQSLSTIFIDSLSKRSISSIIIF